MRYNGLGPLVVVGFNDSMVVEPQLVVNRERKENEGRKKKKEKKRK